jgi:hypothetical protein
MRGQDLSPIAAKAGARPLVLAFGNFGDMVLLTVLLRQLQRRFGGPVDLVASAPCTRALMKGQPVRDLFLITPSRAPYCLSRDQQQLVAWLRERGPGPTWLVDPAAGRSLLLRSGTPENWICDLQIPPDPDSLGDLYSQMGNQTPAGLEGQLPPPVSFVSRNANLVVEPNDYVALHQWRTRRGLIGRSCVVVHPGNPRTPRSWFRQKTRYHEYWPEVRWARVVRAVRDELPHHAIVLSGVAAAAGLNADIAQLSRVRDVHNAAGDLPIAVLLPLLTGADSMIATGTGPAHAAAALGCPTVALFGDADPVLFRPGGATTPAVTLTGEYQKHRSLLGIDEGDVIQAWLTIREARSALGLRKELA